MATTKKSPIGRRAIGGADAAPEAKLCQLDDLHLDKSNPRFGAAAGTFADEAALLDYIVTNFGVEDVLSSIAVNGYFKSEPLLAKPAASGEGYVVAEGNRRLVACLILDGDDRATNQAARTKHFKELHERYGKKPYQPVPVLVFKSKDDVAALTPYLGVRHIAGAQQWDSYAKAAWVAQAVEKDELALDDIVAMIGDNTQLAKRMLMGYYVAKQLIETAHFDPSQSQRRGQKSNPDYPFSWVYTALNFRPIRDWLSLPDSPHESPLSGTALDRGARLFAWMFGQKGQQPVIVESREIKDLAKSIGDKNQRRLLQSGLTVSEVAHRARPPAQGLSEALTLAHETLRKVFPELAEGNITSDEADELLPLADNVRRLGARAYRELEKIAGVEAGNDG